jgi:hypothetical protein
MTWINKSGYHQVEVCQCGRGLMDGHFDHKIPNDSELKPYIDL